MNKPVAWRKQLDTGNYLYQEDYFGDAIPLYTHPVKELTDGEIEQISHRYHYTYNPDYVGFAKAILRKAQEK